MTRETWDLDALARRVESLERSNRRLKLFGAALIAAAFALVLLGWPSAGRAEDKSKNEERDLILKDKDGKARAKLTLIDGEPGLVFYGTDGAARGEIRLAEKGIALRHLQKGRLHTGIGLGDEGVALVATGVRGQALTGKDALLLGPGILIPPKKERER